MPHNRRVQQRPTRDHLPDPFQTWLLPSPAVAERRELHVCGVPVELVLFPDRAARRAASHCAMRPDRAPTILAQEALWRSDMPPAVLTPNRYPFAAAASILWSELVEREAHADLIALALALAEPRGGSVLMNTIGAAATLPRAHLHLTAERLTFLSRLPCRPVAPATVGLAASDPALAAVQCVQLAPPFPGFVLGVRGERAARARAAARLLELRATPAVNLISDGETTWVAPRACETPAPHFATPLGCAELWGRFCFEERTGFQTATEASLLHALTDALLPQPA